MIEFIFDHELILSVPLVTMVEEHEQPGGAVRLANWVESGDAGKGVTQRWRDRASRDRGTAGRKSQSQAAQCRMVQCLVVQCRMEQCLVDWRSWTSRLWRGC
jgi:hypothetical protein